MKRFLILTLVPLLGFALMGCPILDDDDSAMDDDDSAMDDDDVMDDDDSGADDVCEGAVAIACGDTLIGETTVGAANNIETYACANIDLTGPEAYYEFTAVETGLVQLDMTPTAEDLDLVVVGQTDGFCDPDGACVDASQEVGPESLSFVAEEGETYTIIVDGYDAAEDTFDLSVNCDVEVFNFVAIASRTATVMDLDTNTPGPDIDAIELFDGADSYWVESLLHVQGDAGTEGNVNDNQEQILGESDMFVDDIDFECILDDEASGNATFWSMGAGDDTLGVVGWAIGKFDGAITIESGDLITAYEVGSLDCSNLNVARDDEYEIFIGLSTLDPSTMTVSDLEGDGVISLGTTGAGGGVYDFDVVIP